MCYWPRWRRFWATLLEQFDPRRGMKRHEAYINIRVTQWTHAGFAGPCHAERSSASSMYIHAISWRECSCAQHAKGFAMPYQSDAVTPNLDFYKISVIRRC